LFVNAERRKRLFRTSNVSFFRHFVREAMFTNNKPNRPAKRTIIHSMQPVVVLPQTSRFRKRFTAAQFNTLKWQLTFM
jgi:hypothetical protein